MKPLPAPTTVLSLVLMLAGVAPAHACGDNQGTIFPLPTLGGTVIRINGLSAGGQLTGYGNTSGNDTHAFLFAGGVMIDLNAPGSDYSQGIAVNSSGQVAGDAAAAVFETHAFLYSNGTLTDIGTLGGTFSLSTGINEAGTVTGNSLPPDGFSFVAFTYQNGTLEPLGTLGGSSSFANAINQSGHVVGTASVEFDFESHAFLYTNGVMLDLGTLGGAYSTALALNDQDVVVGESEDENFETHAFAVVNGQMVDLGTLGGTYSSASAVNAAGQVIGIATTSNDDETHAFLYAAGGMTDLGTLGGSYSEPFALDNLGRVVGVAETTNGADRAFLWQNGVMVDLNSLLPNGSGWVLTSAEFINDAGRVAGYGLYAGLQRAYVFDLGSGNNNSPVAVAGADQTVECGNQVVLDGSASVDPDGDALTYEWSLNGSVLGTNASLTLSLELGTHVVSLRVVDACGLAAEDNVAVTVMDTTAPSVTCPAAMTLSPSSGCEVAAPDFTAQVVITDNCTALTELTVVQSPAAGTPLGLGAHTFTVTVTDGAGNSAACETTVTVTDTTPPAITSCPATLSVAAAVNCQGIVPSLTSSVAAADNCTAAGQLAMVQTPEAGTSLPVGVHTLSVVIADAAGNTTTTNVTLMIADTTAPGITSITANPSVLSPPNKQSVPVSLTVLAVDSCDPAPVSQIVSVTCDEPPAVGDIEITGPLTVNLVATKNSGGAARVYTITVEAADASGNVSTGTVTVTVPKNGAGGGGGKKP